MPARNVKISIIILFIITSSLNVFTQEEDKETDKSEVYDLGEVVVTATRTEIEVLDAPAHITVITKEDIEDAGGKNIAEILSLQSGITINDYGPEGAQKNISIRGAGSKGVLVLIDGVRLNDSRSGGTDLSLIPLNIIEKIEIVRGGTSALYGADAVGGIINIITKKEADNHLEIKIENSSYIPGKANEVSEGGVQTEVDADPMDLLDTQEININYSYKAGDINIITSGSVINARNEYIWYDNEIIDNYRRKTNADLFKTDLYTGISFPLFTGEFIITGLFDYSQKGISGSIEWPTTDVTQTDIYTQGSIQYITEKFFCNFLTFDMKMFYKFANLDYRDPDEFYPVEDLHTTHSVGIDATQQMLHFDLFSLVYGFNLFYDFTESTQIGTRDRISGGVFLESPIYITSFFSLTPVIRYDMYSDFPNDITYKLGAVFTTSNSSSIKASVSKSYRSPTFNDLYWPSSGNPDLVSETGYSGDLGVSLFKDWIDFDIFGFIRLMQDEIMWSPDELGMWRPFNLGETLYPGLEANIHVTLWKTIGINVNYTFIYSYVLKGRDTDYTIDDDMRVPYVPLHSLNAGIEYKDKKNLIGVNARIESERWHDEANTIQIDPYWVMNAYYKLTLTDYLMIKFSVNNISAASYQIINGYPIPPLSFRTGIEILF